MTTMRNTALCAIASASLLTTTAGYAHHSYAEFDRSHEITKQGTVKAWEWTNPHCHLVIDVAAPNNAVEEWDFEGASPAMISRFGTMTRKSINTGDKIAVTFYPSRARPNFGSLNGITWPDGHSFHMGPPNPRIGGVGAAPPGAPPTDAPSPGQLPPGGPPSDAPAHP